MGKKLKSAFWFTLRLAVSAGLLAFVLWKANLGSVLGELRGASPPLLMAALLSVLAAYLVASARWWLLLRAHVPEAGFWEVLSATFAGLFLGNVLPSGAGVDLVRGGYLVARGRPGAPSFASIFVDRLVGLLVLAAVAALGLWGKPGLRWVGAAAFFGIALSGSLLFSRRFGSWFERTFGKIKFWNLGARLSRFLEGVRHYRGRPSLLLAAAGLSVLLQVFLATAGLLGSLALGQRLPPYVHYLFVPAVNLLAMIPITLAGIGVREGGFVFFYSAYLEPGQAVALSLTYYLVSVAPTLLGALPLLGTKLAARKSNLR